MNTIMKRTSNGSSLPIVGLSGLVDSIFPNNLNRFLDENLKGFSSLDTQSVPVNIRDTDTSYQMEVVAPGFKKEDFKIAVNGELLTVSLSHTEESKEEDKSWKRQEYKRQSFKRSFTLDNTIDTTKIEAVYKDGLLHVTLPKKEGTQNVFRNIEIQ